jgi:hypothetical protein
MWGREFSEPADLWDSEYYLTQRRKEIDSYEYKYSQLPQVFGRLLQEQTP